MIFLTRRNVCIRSSSGVLVSTPSCLTMILPTSKMIKLSASRYGRRKQSLPPAWSLLTLSSSLRLVAAHSVDNHQHIRTEGRLPVIEAQSGYYYLETFDIDFKW